MPKRNWFKAIRGLMLYSVWIGMRPDDPTEGIKNVKVRKSEGHHTWTDDEIKQYRAHWPLGTQQRLAVELALETTSRRADVTRIGPQHERNGKLDLRHTKNNVEAFIPITAELRAAIDACPTRQLSPSFIQRRGRRARPKRSGAISGYGVMLRAYRNVARYTGSARAARGVWRKRECSESRQQLIRRFSAAAVMAEQLEAGLARGEPINIQEHATLSSTLVRLAARIGINRLPKTISRRLHGPLYGPR
jgi:hypothetical protein